MKGLSPSRGLVAALKADALSLSAWQVGMYAWPEKTAPKSGRTQTPQVRDPPFGPS